MSTRTRTLLLVLLMGLMGLRAASPRDVHAQPTSPTINAPQPSTPIALRDGANHHLGDDSFIAAFGRPPTAHDTEQVRMHTHLRYVRAMLAQQPATAPTLVRQRQALLSFLDDYIALGITPRNRHVAHRSPVFIDDDGHICAVGYLIERSVGRAVAEKIAATHRYDYLETIVATMPAAQAWVAASGFTLTELASIQPGYTAEVDQWQRWETVTVAPSEATSEPAAVNAGAIRKGHMHGTWTRTSAAKNPLGQGTFKNGAGRWRSVYPTGSVLAEGNYVNDLPSGTWSFFHPSGRLAAQGGFRAGVRHGAWQFFYDDAAHTPIARGSYKRGDVVGPWQHFDARGKVFAVTSIDTPPQWRASSTGGHFLATRGSGSGALGAGPEKGAHERTLEAGPVQFQSHQTDMGADSRYLATVFNKSDRVYLEPGDLTDQGEATELVRDARGNLLTRGDTLWQAAACPWTKAQIKAAEAGELAKLQGLLEPHRRDPPPCGKPVAINATRSQRIDALLQAHKNHKIAVPEFVTKLLSAPRPGATTVTDDDAAAEPEAAAPAPDNMIKMLDHSMGWYIEWPHIDQQFIAVYRTLPGFLPSF
ncbi:MAG: hypothetical protein KBG15_09905 [Kofleriaceae bacterium]|nr:hypothetical protein [Kofleriaceae bacterium]